MVGRTLTPVGANYDIEVDHSERSIGYAFASFEEAGGPPWTVGLAQALLPSVREDTFNYAHIPPSVSVAVPFQGFAGGSGVNESDDTGHYNYATGVDASWGVPVLAAEPQGLGIIIAPVTKFLNTSLGLFAISENHIYEYDGDSWTRRYAVGSTFYTDIIEKDGVIYVARGDAAYVYSTDGIAWTVSTRTFRPYFFAVRGTREGAESLLWGCKQDGEVRWTADGRNDGTGIEWSGMDRIGHSSETVNSFVFAGQNLLAGKNTGIYEYDGIEESRGPPAVYRRDDDGKNLLYSLDGLVYASYGGALLGYRLADGAAGRVWPTDNMRDNSVAMGQVTALAEDRDSLYAGVKAENGNSYLWKYVRGAWHTVADFGANDCHALLFLPPGIIHTDNPVLLYGAGSGSGYFILPRPGRSPNTDDNCRFVLRGEMIGAWHTIGAEAIPKRLTDSRVLVENVSDDVRVEVYSERDLLGVRESRQVATEPGADLASVGDDEVLFYRIRYIYVLITDDDEVTPVLDTHIWDVVPSPPRRRRWIAVVRTGGGTRSGSQSQYGRAEQESHLFNGVGEHAKLRVPNGEEFIASIQNVRGINVDKGSEVGLYQVEFVEGTALGSVPNIAVWDQSYWDDGSVWG